MDAVKAREGQLDASTGRMAESILSKAENIATSQHRRNTCLRLWMRRILNQTLESRNSNRAVIERWAEHYAVIAPTVVRAKVAYLVYFHSITELERALVLASCLVMFPNQRPLTSRAYIMNVRVSFLEKVTYCARVTTSSVAQHITMGTETTVEPLQA